MKTIQKLFVAALIPLAFFLVFLAAAQGGAPITDVRIQGTGSEISSGATLTAKSGSTFASEAGSTINLSLGSVTFSSTVSLLGQTIELDGSEVANTLPWAKLNKTGSSLADLETRSAADLSSGTVAVARLPVIVGDSGSGGTAGIAPAPGAGDSAAKKVLNADGTFSNVQQIQGVLVDTTAPTSGQGLVYDNATSKWKPSAPASNATQIQGINVSSTAPTDNQVLVYDSGSSQYVPEAGGGASGTKTYAIWTPTQGQPPSSNYATLDTRNSINVLDFDADTDEAMVFVGIIPEAANLASGLKVIIKWTATSATSGNVVWGAQIERCNTDLDADSFDTAATATGAANGTSGILTSTTITDTNIDSVAIGELYRVKVYRDADNGSDTMTGDAEIISIELQSAS